MPDNHYYPRQLVAQWKKNPDHDTCLIMDRSYIRDDRNPSRIFYSNKILTNKMDKRVFKSGSQFNVDGICSNIREQIELFGKKPELGMLFNRQDLAILGYIVYELNPRNYSIFENMDFFVDQEDPQFGLFVDSNIYVATPLSLNRSFVLADNPVTTFSPNGFFNSVQKISLENEFKKFGIVIICSNADYYFCLPIHPKYMIIFHYRTEMYRRKYIPSLIPLNLLTDDMVTWYNLKVFQNCNGYVLGNDYEFNKIVERSKK